MQPGDVLFVSKTRPGVPGYAHARETRLCGVDALNKWLGPLHWLNKNEQGTYRYILVDPFKVSDDWRKVPLLQEWVFDGICLSNDERNLYRGSMSMQREGQLYNIAVQGPCMVNNGYVEEYASKDGLTMVQQGQITRSQAAFAPGYMDHRVERFGKDKVEVDQSYDFAADYRGFNYHLYPLQMFGRDVRPLQDVFVGLVATEYSFGDEDAKALTELAKLETQFQQVSALAKSDPASVPKATLKTAKQKLAKAKKEYKKAFVNMSAFKKMGWWNETEARLLDSNANGDRRPKTFYAFRYVFFTSGQMWELAAEYDPDDPTTSVNPATMAAKGEPVMSKRRKLTEDPYDQDKQRKLDFRRMVGAWHIGKVMDMKAGKMPYFEGGPVETGYQLTVNVNFEWWDWRQLRRKYTPGGSKTQICDLYETPWTAGPELEHTLLFQWPTMYDEAADETAKAGGEAAYGANPNVPVSTDEFALMPIREQYKQRVQELRAKKEQGTASPDELAELKNQDVVDFALQKFVVDQKTAYLTAYFPTSGGDSSGDGSSGGDGTGITSALHPGVFTARLAKLPPMPTLEGNDPAKVLEASLKRFDALFAPMTPEEHAGEGSVRGPGEFCGGRAVRAHVCSRVDSPTGRQHSRAVSGPDGFRGQRVWHGKEPVAPTPTAAPAPALTPVIEAPSAPSDGWRWQKAPQRCCQLRRLFHDLWQCQRRRSARAAQPGASARRRWLFHGPFLSASRQGRVQGVRYRALL